MSYPSETCGCGRTDGCKDCRPARPQKGEWIPKPITIKDVVAVTYPASLEAEVSRLTAEVAVLKDQLHALAKAAADLTVERNALKERAEKVENAEIRMIIEAVCLIDRTWDSTGECGNCDRAILRRALIDYLYTSTASTKPPAQEGR